MSYLSKYVKIILVTPGNLRKIIFLKLSYPLFFFLIYKLENQLFQKSCVGIKFVFWVSFTALASELRTLSVDTNYTKTLYVC